MTIYSEFSHEKWWFSIVMLNYQRVILKFTSKDSIESSYQLKGLRGSNWKWWQFTMQSLTDWDDHWMVLTCRLTINFLWVHQSKACCFDAQSQGLFVKPVNILMFVALHVLALGCHPPTTGNLECACCVHFTLYHTGSALRIQLHVISVQLDGTTCNIYNHVRS
jgi:hypothetical protein